MTEPETSRLASSRDVSSLDTSREFVRELQESNEELRAENQVLRRLTADLLERLQTSEEIGGEVFDSSEALVSEPASSYAADLVDVGVLLVRTDDLAVERFTPGAAELLDLEPSDLGQSISRAARQLRYDEFEEDIRRVSSESAVIEREVRHERGGSYLVRIRPCGVGEDRAEGVLFSVTHRRLQPDLDEALREIDELRQLVTSERRPGLWRIDLADDRTHWDDRAREIVGIGSSGTVTLEQGVDLVHPEESVSTRSSFESCLAELPAPTYDVERRIVGPDGVARWILVRGRVQYGEIGGTRRPVRVLGLVEDVTARKRRDEVVGQSERRYRRLFQEAQEGILIVATNGVIVDVNRAALEMLEYSIEELQRIDSSRLYVNPRKLRDLWRMLDRDGAVRDEELRLRKKSGEEITCRVSATPRRGPEGVIEAYQIFFRDVTEEQHARQALRESERKFRQLAEQSLMGIALVQHGSFKYVNPKAAELFGYPQAELVDDMAPTDVVHPEDRQLLAEFLRQQLSGGDTLAPHQLRLGQADEEVTHVEAYCSSITSEGEPALLCYILDITERRRLESELLHVQEEERRRIGQELHDGVASQLIGVTMILSSYVQNMRDGRFPAPEDLERVKEMIRDGGEQLRQLSHGLHPGRLKGGTLPQALEELAESMNLRLDGACRFESNCALPHLKEKTATHIYRIAQEAVTNAVKYARADTVRVVLKRDGRAFVLAVEDNGEGFDPEKTHSNGIGMRSMQYRARLIGGQFEVASVPGQGTTVQCRLPGRYESEVEN